MKIAHIADSHLRQRQYGSYDRGYDFLKGLLSAIDKAHEKECKYILHSGDLLDSINPGAPVCIDQLNTIQDLLQKYRMSMFVISGNHDNVVPNWCSRFNKYYSVENGGILTCNYKKIIMEDNGVQVSVYGIPFTDIDSLKKAISEAPEADILMWHGIVKEFVWYPIDNAISLEDFDIDKWKLLALGDQHEHVIKKSKSGKITATYPGSTELCSASEDIKKRMFVYDFNNNGTFTMESVPFETRKVQKFVVTTAEDLQKAIKSFDPGALIFITYQSDIPGALSSIQRAVTEDTIIRALAMPNSDIAVTKDLVTSGIKTIGEFLHENIEKMVSKDIAGRIFPVCEAVLDFHRDTDYLNIVDAYCEKYIELKEDDN